MAGKPLKGLRAGPEGFSLLEVMVAAAMLAVAVIGTGHLFVMAQGDLEGDEWVRAALQIAQNKVEELRSLQWTHQDLTAQPDGGSSHWDPGNPRSLDDQGTQDPGDDLVGFVRWTVVSLDDPLNGQGVEDYRLLRVEVARSPGFEDIPGGKVVLETVLAR